MTNVSTLTFEEMISLDRPPDQLGLYVDTESSFFRHGLNTANCRRCASITRNC